MELDPSLQLQQPLHFCEDFPQEFGLCLWECVQPKEHSWGQANWCCMTRPDVSALGFSMGLRSGLCAGQSSSSTPNSSHHVFMELLLYPGEQPCWNHKVGSTQLAKMTLYPVALGRLWNGTRQSLTHCHCIFWLTSLWCPLVWNSQKQWHEHALSNLLMLHYMFSGSWNTKLAFAALKWLLKGQYAVREGF